LFFFLRWALRPIVLLDCRALLVFLKLNKLGRIFPILRYLT
jgi:hypothetical protein